MTLIKLALYLNALKYQPQWFSSKSYADLSQKTFKSFFKNTNSKTKSLHIFNY